MRNPSSRRQLILEGGAACASLAALRGWPALAQDPAAVVDATDRRSEDKRMDARRKPAEFLAFTGVRAGMRVLDMAAGGGYTTELLARAVGPDGVVFAQGPSPRARERLDGRMKASPTLKIVPLVQPFEAPLPAEAQELDLITFMFNYHDTVHLGVDRAAMNANLFAALKPGGALVVADHSAKPGEGLSVAATLHRIEEATLRSEIEAAGFKLADEAGFLRNPADPRTASSGDAPDQADRFVLKFEKPR